MLHLNNYNCHWVAINRIEFEITLTVNLRLVLAFIAVVFLSIYQSTLLSTSQYILGQTTAKYFNTIVLARRTLFSSE